MGYSAHIDTFARDHLPPRSEWPELVFSLPELQYPERLNCASELLDRMAARHPERLCLQGAGLRWSYAELLEQANRIAHVLTQDMGLVPGNRVLLRAPNHPMLVAAWFAVMKTGGIAVTTMPLLRAKELTEVVNKAQISHALCDGRLREELEHARSNCPTLQQVVYWGEGGSLEARMAHKPTHFANVETASDDTCLIAFTSGTTGQPKGCMHFHRDVLAICDTFGKYILRATPDDVFIGSPPLAFTFGLGGLVLFPMRIGASSVLLEKASPDLLLPAIAEYRASVVFTSPTAYRAMAAQAQKFDLTSLRKCVSAGEPLPASTRKLWKEATGIELIDGIGATEMLHIFISHTEEEARPGATGKPVPGYQACVLDEAGQPLPPGRVGRLAVKGPTGCRYLADERQRNYVQHGWNITGDAYLVDEEGYFVYQARTDDMIVSAGYNIAGPEVEDALLLHPAVAECAVVGAPDPERGQIVKAYVVLRAGVEPSAALVKELQDFVKQKIAPYKYPRAIEFRESLPRTQTGKLQRYLLRKEAEQKRV
ncbi:AMP-binding protein [Meiothermus ruber]|uniref:AMP-dependent synthetase and ligase n=1 Tax=Meiothermus ruber (strain ATCC 35948 / DSM 1279 / VKM B-1258 / 21) TaxID=504728 RepID=D3PTT7_MEIRD|nr:AMP-binding protein [Meiothermus ruber]ADD28870.1 AMP-dependent synthetase and ligase [Meiothermus ruber DSM 1279]AGK05681.1 AMP-dependent synthetase and ligase [Meiothermus ruber DSM 1279]MCL6530844.1 AMP-binding protein [Meiothermus ruber]GAO75785.1 AMP-dependent synthetase and ligase [Meiothermus ruber H328]